MSETQSSDVLNLQPEPTGLVLYAGFWVRFLAHCIDSLILTFISCGLEFGVLGIFYCIKWMLLLKQGETPPPFDEAFNAFFLQIFNAGLYFCCAFPYFVWGHFNWGTTLGKRLFSVYVLQEQTQEKITLQQSVARFFLYGLSYLPMGIGFLMVIFHPHKQGLHDLIAKTISVKKSK
jgi:uncharacterized RDD family membrane protein YckC